MNSLSKYSKTSLDNMFALMGSVVAVGDLPARAVLQLGLSKELIANFELLISKGNQLELGEYTARNTQESLKHHTQQEVVQAKLRVKRANEIMLNFLANLAALAQITKTEQSILEVF